jgi:hypothetical protein
MFYSMAVYLYISSICGMVSIFLFDIYYQSYEHAYVEKDGIVLGISRHMGVYWGSSSGGGGATSKRRNTRNVTTTIYRGGRVVEGQGY